MIFRASIPSNDRCTFVIVSLISMSRIYQSILIQLSPTFLNHLHGPAVHVKWAITWSGFLVWESMSRPSHAQTWALLMYLQCTFQPGKLATKDKVNNSNPQLKGFTQEIALRVQSTIIQSSMPQWVITKKQGLVQFGILKLVGPFVFSVLFSSSAWWVELLCLISNI